MDAEAYPNDKVAALINENFVPVRLHIEENGALAKRFNVTWTPTLMILDENETEHYRLVPGYFPVDDFKPALDVALGKTYFNVGKYDEAIQRFDYVIKGHPKSLAAPAARYWRGVCYYRKGDKDSLVKSWLELLKKSGESRWAKSAAFLPKKLGISLTKPKAKKKVGARRKVHRRK